MKRDSTYFKDIYITHIVHNEHINVINSIVVHTTQQDFDLSETVKSLYSLGFYHPARHPNEIQRTL